MLEPIIRKAAQVMGDPVLRRWLIGRALGKYPGEPRHKAHHPPYLADLLPLVAERPEPQQDFRELVADTPLDAIELPLPGLNLTLQPGDETDLFTRSFADTEVLLAIHRFAWLPMLGDQADPAWVGSIWRAWQAHHQKPDESWAWHPYTAAERVINILRFARDYGLPGSRGATLDCLARYATAIAERLEYFGDHHTSNHLANNGRGLFLLGLWLGLPKATDLGGRILTEEATRIFRPSGVLREGSSHYHLLLAENYRDVAAEAEAHGRPETEALRDIADKATAVAATLILPGGLPLIGDISPDRSPESLLESPRSDAAASFATLAKDGWLRVDHGRWSGLWHVSPDGWRQMPGHGHEDCGGFEIHFDAAPLFIDPGRGTYGKGGDAACSGRAHNTLIVDGKDPYPANRPYYNDAFRHRVCGDGPEYSLTDQGVHIRHQGFSRFGGVGAVSRQCRFDVSSLSVSDIVEGTGKRAIQRLLITPHATQITDGAVILQSANASFRITAPEASLSLVPVPSWTAYGVGKTVTQIRFDVQTPLPWCGDIIVEKI